MADDTLTTKALEKIAFHEGEIRRLKLFVNEADALNGVEPRFGDLEGTEAVVNALARPTGPRFRAGEFFNKPFSTAVRQVLQARVDTLGNFTPATVDDIHEALMQGSFDFGTNGAESQKNSIRISLGKNSAAFVKLPNSDLFGLVEWFGKKAGKPGRKPASEKSLGSENLEVVVDDDGKLIVVDNDDSEAA